MVEETLIEKKQVGKQVLADYANGDTIGTISKKYDLTWQNIAYYLQREEEGNTELWQTAFADRHIKVMQELCKIRNKVEQMITEYTDLKESLTTGVSATTPVGILDSTKAVLVFNKEIRDTLRLALDTSKAYAEIIDKIVRMEEQSKLKRALIEMLNEVDPEIGTKILQKLREFKEKNRLLSM